MAESHEIDTAHSNARLALLKAIELQALLQNNDATAPTMEARARLITALADAYDKVTMPASS